MAEAIPRGEGMSQEVYDAIVKGMTPEQYEAWDRISQQMADASEEATGIKVDRRFQRPLMAPDGTRLDPHYRPGISLEEYTAKRLGVTLEEFRRNRQTPAETEEPENTGA